MVLLLLSVEHLIFFSQYPLLLLNQVVASALEYR
ncbi:hypothetical protein BCE_3174 [Bacillus cereus ATCC 10987]|uniref:Uncharacterized protein n=1 Tax=Bacillus cereus (strain ATCC 10987 / NRS 248) TaxID=222523 RepID=Q735H8_BACC1|nr:hypothetical protein BCE_3174 [Bacillus cereus ATCC 10987]